jgi:hypothetical protein
MHRYSAMSGTGGDGDAPDPDDDSKAEVLAAEKAEYKCIKKFHSGILSILVLCIVLIILVYYLGVHAGQKCVAPSPLVDPPAQRIRGSR